MIYRIRFTQVDSTYLAPTSDRSLARYASFNYTGLKSAAWKAKKLLTAQKMLERMFHYFHEKERLNGKTKRLPVEECYRIEASES